MKRFEMTPEDLKALYDACKPVRYIVVGGSVPRSPQENANDAWERLGKKMGFDHMTVQPSGEGDSVFFAEPKLAAEQDKPVKVAVEYVHPPIPIRTFDYHAYVIGTEDERNGGWGKSRDEALNNLANNIGHSRFEEISL